ncbi:DUF4174 domain-containing protein [Pseudooceanicola sp. C21-150M6]|uniref:DUF4174 domain-containing protein n=1 Tax=Pseudooceanicola sp. C21-150M6 TaxID=3434355 RepID=UPI003D7F6DD8
MFRTAALLATGLVLTGVAATTAAFASTDDLIRPLDPTSSSLDSYRWDARPVLIFAPSTDDPTYRDAIARLDTARADLRDRDIVVLTDTSPDTASPIRKGLGAEGFTMLLVGKDGGVKTRSDEVIAPETLFATIDRMPMRQREVRQD